VPLLIAGEVYRYAEHERHYRDDIRPRLDRHRRFLGPLGGARKRRLLAVARCLLVPSLVAETGSLVAMEALAHGTPVIAFPNGALVDVVEHGVTGFLVRDTAEMARAIRDAPRIDPEACRAAARARFSAEAMVHRYLDLYAVLARGHGRGRVA
jgi:glycosyltransferase involved in cell wall biosynthesis